MEKSSSIKMTFLNLTDYKEIDSIIDKAKASGLFNLEKLTNNDSETDNVQIDDYLTELDETKASEERRLNEEIHTGNGSVPLIQAIDKAQFKNSFARSDSEVTVIHVKQRFRKQTINKWADIHDRAVPGDGTHLGESPSMVNLVTFIKSSTNMNEADECLVPLSSWNPIDSKCLDKQCRKNTSELSEPGVVEFQELHRSLNISKISNSQLNIPYMLKQKLSPEPVTLLNKSPLDNQTKLEINNISTDIDKDNKELQMIKAPSIIERPSLKKRLRIFIQNNLCACCVSKSNKQRISHTFDVGVQTIENESENFD